MYKWWSTISLGKQAGTLGEEVSYLILEFNKGVFVCNFILGLEACSVLLMFFQSVGIDQNESSGFALSPWICIKRLLYQFILC